MTEDVTDRGTHRNRSRSIERHSFYEAYSREIATQAG